MIDRYWRGALKPLMAAVITAAALVVFWRTLWLDFRSGAMLAFLVLFPWFGLFLGVDAILGNLTAEPRRSRLRVLGGALVRAALYAAAGAAVMGAVGSSVAAAAS